MCKTDNVILALGTTDSRKTKKVVTVDNYCK
jgi:hypothetical protein